MTVIYFFLRIKPSWLYLGIAAAGTALFCISAAIICRRKHSELKNTPKHKNAQTLIHGFDELLYISANTKPSWLYLGIAAAGTALFCIFSRSAMLFLISKFDMYKAYNPDI